MVLTMGIYGLAIVLFAMGSIALLTVPRVVEAVQCV
jgi:hypothetical protein